MAGSGYSGMLAQRAVGDVLEGLHFKAIGQRQFVQFGGESLGPSGSMPPETARSTSERTLWVPLAREPNSVARPPQTPTPRRVQGQLTSPLKRNFLAEKFSAQNGKLCAFKFTIPYNVSCNLHGAAERVIDMALLAWTSSISASMQAPEK
jgi:hypothetical protein